MKDTKLSAIINKRINSRYRLILFVLLLIIFLYILAYYFSDDREDFLNKLLFEVGGAIAFSIIAFCAVRIIENITHQKDADEMYNEAIATRILGLLKAEKDKELDKEFGISHLFSDETMEAIMMNSASHFSPKLAKPYKDYLLSWLKPIYSQFDYQVKVESEEGCYMISQTLRYTRFFEPKLDAKGNMIDDVHLVCCFTFGDNKLDKYMSRRYFFSEEITLEDQIKRVQDIVDREEKDAPEGVLRKLCDELKLKIYLDEWYTNDNKKVPSGELKDLKYTVHKTKEGVIEAIVFEGLVPPELCVKEDSLCGYRGHIECRYSAPKSGRFLCVFSNPIVKSTRFAIEFDRGIVKDIENEVDIIKLITAKEVPPIRYSSHISEAEFRTEETIFPRSGICITWPDNSCKKFV